jgi:hypothetical protein
MKDLIRKDDIDKLSGKEQLEFYKKHFQYQHCEFNDCGYEVRHTWVLYNGDLLCDTCFDFNIQQEREEVEKDVESLEKQLAIAKERLSELE